MQQQKIIVAIYNHPEHFPPTLNAVECLSRQFAEVALLFRPHDPAQWPYPKNVILLGSGPAMSVREQMQAPLLTKLRIFVRFALDLLRLIRDLKPAVVLAYDPMSLLALRQVQKTGVGKDALIWYHNHDVAEPNSAGRLSLGAWAQRAERQIFPRLGLFTLPSEERSAYFPMQVFKGKYFFLPNLPAISLYGKHQSQAPEKTLRVIYQGAISGGHGIEEMLGLLPCTVAGKAMHLVLKGRIEPVFEQKIRAIIEEKRLSAWVEFHGYTAYQDLPKLTATCHAGIAIFTLDDVMYRTLGTASNKIYEYAACGLPVLYYDNPHFRKHLGRFAWALPTDLSPDSLLAALQRIATDFEALSGSARADFLGELNFERHFQLVGDYLDPIVSAQKP